MRSKMDFPMENCAQHMDLSLGGGDSNTLILLAKRRNKRKGTNQTRVDLGQEKVKETQNVNFSRTSKLSNSPTPRSLIAPTIVRLSRPEEVENARKDLPNSNGGAGDNGGS